MPSISSCTCVPGGINNDLPIMSLSSLKLISASTIIAPSQKVCSLPPDLVYTKIVPLSHRWRLGFSDLFYDGTLHKKCQPATRQSVLSSFSFNKPFFILPDAVFGSLSKN